MTKGSSSSHWKYAIYSTTAMLSLSLSIPALAQDHERTNGGPSVITGIEDIIVTATRREESMQKVATSVSALSSSSLQEQNIQTVTDLLGKVPSVSIQPNGTQRDSEGVTIRGQGQTYLAPVGVVNYFAEVPLIQGSIIGNQGGPGNFFDLESLQVLRGPQGTLFGKNTTGGALLFGPAKPTEKFHGYVQAQIGNYNDREFEAVLNLPILDDKLLLRVSAQKVDRDGYTKDVGTGDALLSLPYQDFTQPEPTYADVIPNSGLVLPGKGPNTGVNFLPSRADTRQDFRGKDYDDRHYWTIRAGLTFRPTDNIENYLVAYYTKAHNNGTGQVLTSVGQDHATLINLVANAYANDFSAGAPYAFDASDPRIAEQILARQQQLGPRRVSLNTDQFYELETWSIIDTLDIKLSENISFRNIFGYQRMKQYYAWDLDGSHLPILSQIPGRITEQALVSLPALAEIGKVGDTAHITNASMITEEPQFHGEFLDGKIVGVVGGFFSKQKPKGLQATNSYNAATFGGGFYGITTTSKAVYGQATTDFGIFTPALDKLRLTAGIRRTWDEFEGYSYSPGYVVLAVNNANVKNNATTWTLGLDYQLSDQAFLFGKITKGYKAGGYNYAAVQARDATFGPERVTSYEIGAKTDFTVGNVPVRFNIAAYNLDYTDIQRANSSNVANGCTPGGNEDDPIRCILTGNQSGLDQGAVTYNAGAARVRGIETELTARLFQGFELSGSYSYTKAKYKSYFMLTPPDPASGPQVGTQQTCTGAVPIPTGTTGVLVDLSCSPFPFTPTHQFSLNGRYAHELGENGTLVTSVNYSHATKTWTAPASLPISQPSGFIDAYHLINASVTWQNSMGIPIDLRLFVNNLTNKTYRISNSNGDDNSLGYSASIYGEPRMYGLSLRYSFE